MKCRHCGSVVNLNISYIRTNKDSKRTIYICRDCNREKAKKYRATEKGAEAVRISSKKYLANNKHRYNAWMKCKVLEDKPCEVCGEEKVDKHHRDYDKPLEVVWLCRTHHKEEHKKFLV